MRERRSFNVAKNKLSKNGSLIKVLDRKQTHAMASHFNLLTKRDSTPPSLFYVFLLPKFSSISPRGQYQKGRDINSFL